MKKKSEDTVNETADPAEEWKKKYLRALADYQNLEKYTKGEIDKVRLYANENLISQLLPVVDSLEMAYTHLSDKGVELVLKQFHDVLTGRGIVRLNVIGRQFDPIEMECIEVAEGVENIVLAELRPGYRMFDKVIRPARVKVGKSVKKPADTISNDGIKDQSLNSGNKQ